MTTTRIDPVDVAVATGWTVERWDIWRHRDYEVIVSQTPGRQYRIMVRGQCVKQIQGSGITAIRYANGVIRELEVME